MELMDHERLMIAKFYCEQALKVIDGALCQPNDGTHQRGSVALYSANRALERAAQVTDVPDAD